MRSLQPLLLLCLALILAACQVEGGVARPTATADAPSGAPTPSPQPGGPTAEAAGTAEAAPSLEFTASSPER